MSSLIHNDSDKGERKQQGGYRIRKLQVLKLALPAWAPLCNMPEHMHLPPGQYLNKYPKQNYSRKHADINNKWIDKKSLFCIKGPSKVYSDQSYYRKPLPTMQLALAKVARRGNNLSVYNI